jgi:hypothetical protein
MLSTLSQETIHVSGLDVHDIVHVDKVEGLGRVGVPASAASLIAPVWAGNRSITCGKPGTARMKTCLSAPAASARPFAGSAVVRSVATQALSIAR